MGLFIVAHPNRQHSFRLATALNKAGLLDSYITTVYDRPHSVTRVIKSILPKKLRGKIAGKHSDGFSDEQVVQYYELLGLVFLSMIRLPLLKKYYRRFGSIVNNKFGVKVAKYAIRRGVEGVVMYDTTADSCFEYLRKHAPGIKRILDVSSIVSSTRVRIYETIMTETGLPYLQQENAHLWDENLLSKNKNEVLNTDFFLAPSTFVINSLVESKAPLERIFLLRYGVDIHRFKSKTKDVFGVLRLVYTGNVTYGKGIQYLLQSAQFFKDLIHVDICGDFDKDSPLFKDNAEIPNVTFHGFITHQELISIYSEADLFVFPSLGEGFSLAALEALACGLPVICSSNSGINDVVEDYYNGMTFDAGNQLELNRAIQWFIDNKNKIAGCSHAARNTAEKLTWDIYNDRVFRIFNSIMKS